MRLSFLTRDFVRSYSEIQLSPGSFSAAFSVHPEKKEERGLASRIAAGNQALPSQTHPNWGYSRFLHFAVAFIAIAFVIAYATIKHCHLPQNKHFLYLNRVIQQLQNCYLIAFLTTYTIISTEQVSIYAPYWIINNTGIPLVFKQDAVPHDMAGQFDEHEMARSLTPLLFSFSDRDAPTRYVK